MDSTIVAALISGGVGVVGIAGTVVTSVVGSRNTRRATEQAIAAGAANTRATLAAAREGRLWEKRCAAYEETLTALLHRQAKRQEDMREYRLDEAYEQQVKEFFAAYEPPGFFETQGRLLAYASNPVIAASNGASKEHAEVRRLYQQYLMMADDNKRATTSGQFGIAHGGEETIAALDAAKAALKRAGFRDDLLIAIIREELSSKPEAALQPATALPAERRANSAADA
jgi:hypothetical protein